MSPADDPGTDVTVLVALDASPGSLAALDAAAEVARLLGAELAGVFVQDVNVLRLGENPAVREMPRFGGPTRRPSRRDMETALEAQAARARRAIERVAEVSQVTFTFQELQGLVVNELTQRARTAEVVAVGRVAGTERPTRRLGSTARGVLDRAEGPVLFLPPGQRLAPPLAVLFDGSAGASQALELAARLAGDAGLLILVPRGPDTGSTAKLMAAAQRAAAAAGCPADVVAIRSASFPVVCDALHIRGAGVVVTPRPLGAEDDDTITRLIVEMDLPVLVVPSTGERS